MSVWLITGANRGIGLELVRQLAARGDEVIATARDPQSAHELANIKPAAVEKLDVSDPVSIEEFGRRIARQRIDVLVNNAGVRVDLRTATGYLPTLTANSLMETYVVNAVGPVLLAKALDGPLASNVRVVNMSSTLGSISSTSHAEDWSYSMSKAAMNMHTRKLAAEWPARTVISISPGWVKTDMGGADASLTPSNSVTEMLQVIDDLTPDQSGSFLRRDGAEIPW